MNRTLTLVIFIAAMQVIMGQLNTRQRQESSIFEQLFLRPRPGYFGTQRYDSRIQPNEPITVRVSMIVTNIAAINTQSNFRVQLILQQNWTDNRLAFNAMTNIKYLTLTDVYRIWKPNLHFLNEIYGFYHYIVYPNTFARIYPNGQVLYNIRMTLFFSCKIDYLRIPFDRYECSIPLTNFGSKNDEDVTVTWNENEPVLISQQFKIPLFKLQKFTPEYCNSSNEEEKSCIQLKITFKRELHTYMTRYFFPFMALVIVSWFPFWTHHDVTHIRLSVPILTILVARDLSFGHNIEKNAPYNTMAIDIWMAFCFFLLIAAFLQYVLLIFLLNRRQEKSQFDKNKAITKSEDKLSGRRCERIDVICRFLFPSVFLVFNLLYWSVYMGKKII